MSSGPPADPAALETTLRWEWQRLKPILEQKQIRQATKKEIATVFERRELEKLPQEGKDAELTEFCAHFGIKHSQIATQYKNWKKAARAADSVASASTGTPASDGPATTAAVPAPLPPRAWLHHDVHAALLELQGDAAASSCAAVEATELLRAVRAAATDSEHISDEEGTSAIATMGERGWVVFSAGAGEAMEEEGDECAAALAALRARGWLVGSSEKECLASLGAQAQGAEAQAEVSAEEAEKAVRTLCEAGRCFVRDSTSREWERFVFELRRREQDKAVRLLTAELDDVDGWRLRLEEMAERGGAVGERVSKRIAQPKYGQPEVSREWPRALLDAPCAWGKTVGSIKVAVELFRNHPDLHTVAVFEHRLDLIEQVMKEWAKWAKELDVELEMFTVCSLKIPTKASAAGASKAASSSGSSAAAAEDDDDAEAAEAEDEEQNARTDADAKEAGERLGASRLEDTKAVKETLLKTPSDGKLRVFFVCYDSTVLLKHAYGVNSKDKPEPLGLAIFDEAHVMAAGGGDSKEYSHALALYDKNVPIRRRLFMTATPKVAMVKRALADAKEEGEEVALSMGEEEVYGSEHVQQCDESGRRDVVRGRSYSMRFDEAITRGLITDYRLLVISADGKGEMIQELAEKTLSTEDGSPLAKQLAEWKTRYTKVDPEKPKEKVPPVVEALEVAKVKALEDALVNHGLQKVFVFSSLKRWAELFGILASQLIVDKSKRETASDPDEAAPPLLVPDKVHVVHSSAEYRAHKGYEKKDAASARAKREGSGYDAVKVFGASEPPAVLSNVRSLGTGTDCPRADGTMFGTSKGDSIGAVQEAGRSFRLDLPKFDDSGVVLRPGNKTKVAKVLLCVFEGEADLTATGRAPRSSKATKAPKAGRRGRKARPLHPPSSGGDRGSVMNVLKAFQSVDVRMDGLVRSAHRVLINGRERALTDVLSQAQLARFEDRVTIEADEARKKELTMSVVDACVPRRTWEEMFEKLKAYKEEEGDCNVPAKYEADPQLGTWVDWQKAQYKKEGHGSLATGDRLEKLRALGALDDWAKAFPTWEEMFERLEKYRAEKGDCNVPRKYAADQQLSTWVTTQKTQYNKPGHGNLATGDRLEKLRALGAIDDWEKLAGAGDEAWQEMFEKLEAYKAEEGDCNVPTQYADDPQLGTWVNNQKEQYRKEGHGVLANGDRLEKLRQLGALDDWEKLAGADGAAWQAMYEKLEAYKDEKGNCNVPQRYAADLQLGSWVKTQKKQYKKKGHGTLATGGRLEKLRALGALDNWETAAARRAPPTKQTWEEFYEKLTAYKAKEGDCNVPAKYAADQKLSRWVTRQKAQYKMEGQGNLATGDRLEKLRALGAIDDWEKLAGAGDEAWQEMYEKLEAYKAEEGDCNVPQKYAADPRFGTWVDTQKAQYRKEGNGTLATGDRLEKLRELGALDDWAKVKPGRRVGGRTAEATEATETDATETEATETEATEMEATETEEEAEQEAEEEAVEAATSSGEEGEPLLVAQDEEDEDMGDGDSEDDGGGENSEDGGGVAVGGSSGTKPQRTPREDKDAALAKRSRGWKGYGVERG